ncbi:MAG TPA: hypothetical protein PKM20_01665 [Nitrosomonas sp.]|nr:hypothetical protein [Nitrosomonas sp.]HNP25425.1 hypothetical protein [Nitrosomonas sp.]
MIFSAGFLTFLVYGALGWCAATGIILMIMLLEEWMKGKLW